MTAEVHALPPRADVMVAAGPTRHVLQLCLSAGWPAGALCGLLGMTSVELGEVMRSREVSQQVAVRVTGMMRDLLAGARRAAVQEGRGVGEKAVLSSERRVARRPGRAPVADRAALVRELTVERFRGRPPSWEALRGR